MMGVSGCGKSTIGRALAQRLGRPFIEGDDFHPADNISKMQTGQPLENADRRAWIDALCGAVSDSPPAVISCSALNVSVRGWLHGGIDRPLVFIHLSGSQDLVAARLSQRGHHFFSPELLASQFAALDLPRRAITIKINQPMKAVLRDCLIALAAQSHTRHGCINPR